MTSANKTGETREEAGGASRGGGGGNGVRKGREGGKGRRTAGEQRGTEVDVMMKEGLEGD